MLCLSAPALAGSEQAQAASAWVFINHTGKKFLCILSFNVLEKAKHSVHARVILALRGRRIMSSEFQLHKSSRSTQGTLDFISNNTPTNEVAEVAQ